jgi:hypothetical protein
LRFLTGLSMPQLRHTLSPIYQSFTRLSCLSYALQAILVATPRLGRVPPLLWHYRLLSILVEPSFSAHVGLCLALWVTVVYKSLQKIADLSELVAVACADLAPLLTRVAAGGMSPRRGYAIAAAGPCGLAVMSSERAGRRRRRGLMCMPPNEIIVSYMAASTNS